jgi:hypothetical protein
MVLGYLLVMNHRKTGQAAPIRKKKDRAKPWLVRLHVVLRHAYGYGKFSPPSTQNNRTTLTSITGKGKIASEDQSHPTDFNPLVTCSETRK